MTLRQIQAFLWRHLPVILFAAVGACSVSLLRCQSLSLSRVGSGTVPAGGSATLNVVLSGSAGAATALQWNISADAAGTVLSGASLTPATLTQAASIGCSPSGNICVIYNLHGSVALPDTAIASLTVTIPAGASSVTVTLSNPLGANAIGDAVHILGPAVTIPVSSGTVSPPSYANSVDLGQFSPAVTVTTPTFDPQGGNFVALKVVCGGCQAGSSSVNAVTFTPTDLNFGPQPMKSAALVSANGVVDVWTFTAAVAPPPGVFTVTTGGIAILQLQAYSAKNVATLTASTNVVSLGNAMATTTVTAAAAGDLLAVFSNGVAPFKSDTGTVRLTGIMDQTAVAGANTIHTEVDFQGPSYANAIVVLDLQGKAGLAVLSCTTQRLVPAPVSPAQLYFGPGINQDGDVVRMTPWTSNTASGTVRCLDYLRKATAVLGWVGEQCCFV